MRVFEQDSSLMRILARVFDLILLNSLFILFSLPVLTIGASLTATHYTALKMHREEGTVVKNFLKSFKENFRQSTLLWVVMILYVLVIAIDVAIVYRLAGGAPIYLRLIVLALMLYSLFVGVWIFPLQSRFVNGMKGTIRMAFFCSAKHFLRSWYMVILHVLPIVWIDVFSFQMYWPLLLVGISLPIYLSAVSYNKVFKTLEDNAKNNQA